MKLYIIVRPDACPVKEKGLTVMQWQISIRKEKFNIRYATETSPEQIPTDTGS